MTRTTNAERQEAIDQLKEWFNPGDTVYTICRSVARSGMSAVYSIVIFRDGYALHPNYRIAQATGHQLTRDTNTGRDGIRMHGCGYDRAYQIVYDLGRALYGDGYALKHESI